MFERRERCAGPATFTRRCRLAEVVQKIAEPQVIARALSFAKVAFPALAGQGLKARVWIGKRIGACEIWPIAPHMISV